MGVIKGLLDSLCFTFCLPVSELPISPIDSVLNFDPVLEDASIPIADKVVKTKAYLKV